ncbi:MAG: SMP-30/gluconolactonase/LRE family protein [Sphingobium sp.]|nr:SMP-30/gluconolactonase/LRE family protein [Sphingobium sp.]MCP5398807.1 SMP-30/gluconolactonase/LRE family protein [Sphingomonas sp.]
MMKPVGSDLLCIWQAEALLGEGPWWSVADQALYWVDIKQPEVLRTDTIGSIRDRWPSPEMIGCFAPRAQGGFVGGFRSGLCTFTLGSPGDSIKLHAIARPDGYSGTDRFNDGKCHPDGSFWAGTMDDAEREARGHFYRLSVKGALESLSGPHMVCNGPAFSPDGRFAYLTDSARRTIYRMDLACHGRLIEPFVIFSEKDGFPDGMTTDTEGRLWIAFWDGWKVMALAPSGERLTEIHLPVSRPTSCAFGGPGLSTLFITSARIGLNPTELASQPLAGGLFACSITGAEGWSAPTYRG